VNLIHSGKSVITPSKVIPAFSLIRMAMVEGDTEEEAAGAMEAAAVAVAEEIP